MAAVLLAVVSGVRGIRWFRTPEGKRTRTECVIRGFRSGIVGLALVAIAVGLHWELPWIIVLGLVFLGEELFETGIMLLAVRSERPETPNPSRGETGGGDP